MIFAVVILSVALVAQGLVFNRVLAQFREYVGATNKLVDGLIAEMSERKKAGRP